MFALYLSARQDDGRCSPWSIYNLLPCSSQLAHKLAREDRANCPDCLIAVRHVDHGFPRPPIGQCCSLIERFCPPYPDC